jgi:multiple sugar transport system permease protein
VNRRPLRGLGLGLLFIGPWIIGFCVFYLYPFVATFYYSFTRFTGFGNPVFIGLANYDGLLHDATFRTALSLNMNVRGQAIYRTLFYIPSVVPVVASSLIFVWIFSPQVGLVNSLLADAHIPGPGWFFSIPWSKPTFILLGLWGMGQPMVIYLAALQAVPREMYEVAALEGAGPIQRLRTVTIPMISPVILLNMILALVTSIQYFTQAQVIENPPGGPGTSTMFYVSYYYQQTFLDLHLGYGSAMAYLLFILVLIITAVLLKTSSRWVYYANEER